MAVKMRISGKNLGALALPERCDRCIWLKQHPSVKLPYQVFPGIFSSIDAYSKRLLHGYFDQHGEFPIWLKEAFETHGIGNPTGYINPPSFHKFNRTVSVNAAGQECEIMLTGAADAILEIDGSTHMILDYKTAKFTKNQDVLMPVYEVQQNAYAFIADEVGPKDVTQIALLYTEPVTDSDAAIEEKNNRDDGFAMGFSTHLHPLTLEKARVTELLIELATISLQDSAPARRKGCKECEKLDVVLGLSDKL